MDPITVTHLAHDRIRDLQETADAIRQERVLRTTASARVVAPVTRLADTRRTIEPAGRCSSVETAT